MISMEIFKRRFILIPPPLVAIIRPHSCMITSCRERADPRGEAPMRLEADNTSCSWTPGLNWPRCLLGGCCTGQRTAGEWSRRSFTRVPNTIFPTKTACIDLRPHMTACFHTTRRLVSGHMINPEPARCALLTQPIFLAKLLTGKVWVEPQ